MIESNNQPKELHVWVPCEKHATLSSSQTSCVFNALDWKCELAKIGSDLPKEVESSNDWFGIMTNQVTPIWPWDPQWMSLNLLKRVTSASHKDHTELPVTAIEIVLMDLTCKKLHKLTRVDSFHCKLWSFWTACAFDRCHCAHPNHRFPVSFPEILSFT